MTTRDTEPGTVIGQVLYCWSTRGLSGTHGFGFRAVSEDVRADELRGLEPECASFRPSAGTARTLARVILDSDRVAVIHTKATAHADGRHVAHALLARPEDLEAFLAATLWLSPLWLTDESELDPASTALPRLDIATVAGHANRLARPDLTAVTNALAECAAGKSVAIGKTADDAASTVGFAAFSMPVRSAAQLCFTIGKAQRSGLGTVWLHGNQQLHLDAEDVAALVQTAEKDTPQWQELRCDPGADLDYLATVAVARSGSPAAPRLRLWDRRVAAPWAGVLLGEPPVAQAYVDAVDRQSIDNQQALLQWARGLPPPRTASENHVGSQLLAEAVVRSFEGHRTTGALACLHALLVVCGHDLTRVGDELTNAGAATWTRSIGPVLLGAPRDDRALAGLPPSLYLELAQLDDRMADPAVMSDVVAANVNDFAELALDGRGGDALLSQVLATPSGATIALQGLRSDQLTWLQLEIAAQSIPGSAALLRSCLAAADAGDQRWLRDHETILDAIRPFISDLPALEAVLAPFLWDEPVRAGAIERWRRRGDQSRLERERERREGLR